CVSIAEYGLGSLVDVIVYPNTCWPYFYTAILGFLWLLIATLMYNSELKRNFTSEMLSCVAIGGIAITILSLIGTIIVGSNGVPMVGPGTLRVYLSATIIV